MLAVARAMGETAPLLLTTLGNDLFVETNPGERMSTLSLQIFGSATGGFPAAQARAWAGALTLIVIVLLLTIIARLDRPQVGGQPVTTPERPDVSVLEDESGPYRQRRLLREPGRRAPRVRRGAWTSST